MGKFQKILEKFSKYRSSFPKNCENLLHTAQKIWNFVSGKPYECVGRGGYSSGNFESIRKNSRNFLENLEQVDLNSEEISRKSWRNWPSSGKIFIKFWSNLKFYNSEKIFITSRILILWNRQDPLSNLALKFYPSGVNGGENGNFDDENLKIVIQKRKMAGRFLPFSVTGSPSEYELRNVKIFNAVRGDIRRKKKIDGRKKKFRE